MTDTTILGEDAEKDDLIDQEGTFLNSWYVYLLDCCFGNIKLSFLEKFVFF